MRPSSVLVESIEKRFSVTTLVREKFAVRITLQQRPPLNGINKSLRKSQRREKLEKSGSRTTGGIVQVKETNTVDYFTRASAVSIEGTQIAITSKEYSRCPKIFARIRASLGVQVVWDFPGDGNVRGLIRRRSSRKLHALRYRTYGKQTARKCKCCTHD